MGISVFSLLKKRVDGDIKQEDQVTLNRSPEFCLKLTYRYLLKADHVTGDIWDGTSFGPRGII